ncbi:HsdM family class I SAM-dependent methyltransferase [Alcaligenes aquatilis]|uniref:site-specific DNA-methyltransferase (adenine-specific) n=1 Tax=Alcaligenes aquatilis TaxID=323284 RepID=A0A3G2HSU7_9BURK|nr:N-6 DNA methylase [Alcaligenes aquatilis]AYN20085.1 restriction endonuclease subunit M [Alcaligenes aquatilis]
MADIFTSLADFGADRDALRLFDADGPDLLPYATLLAARRDGHKVLGAISAVYEWQGAPLIFLVDAGQLESDNQLHQIRRLLAMRGDAPYLGVVAPGRLDVYRIALDKHSLRESYVEINADDSGRYATLAILGNARPSAAISQRNWISNVILNLLTGSITRLITQGGVTDEDAISLVGRALFTRFLADRNLLPDSMAAGSHVAVLFDDRTAAERTSKWLDATFNGDLLPLSETVFDALPGHAYAVLGDILRRAPDSQLFLGWDEKWGNLDFAHIPVGVLSQAYELYLRNHAPQRQRREGGYYTPRAIADLMVRASFRALERGGVSSQAKVLDPAAGAGVFLLTAFRELVAARWRVDETRPATEVLRSILYSQVVGFDINEAALRFAALGLYLMSIELDPHPKPVDKLRFENLRGRVLHRFDVESGQEGARLGSLGPLVDQQHLGQYDLVIGNPPWSSATKLPDWHLVRDTVARMAVSRQISNPNPPLPNEGLDLPFVWRAMEWAKPNGQIAFALHARLLFQQGDGMVEARQALFDALDVTSVINGSELRQTKVWPEITAPFCILFATNSIPGASAGFRFVSPRLEESLNEAGGMRIDALNADVIPSSQLAQTPDILKILFRGTRADLAIVERIRAHGHPTLEAYWRDRIGVTERGHLQGSGNGYQRLRQSSEVRGSGGERLPGVDASVLLGLPEIEVGSFSEVSIKGERLKLFSQQRVHRLRSIDLFVGPLVIVHQSPPASTGRIGIAISEENVVFNETFYGYSPGKHPDAAVLVQYLALILGSKLAVWISLVTSGKFGFEREVIEKATLDRIPIPDFDAIAADQREEITQLFERLRIGKASWDEVDEWVARLYGLGARDLQVISDTLAFSLPFSENKRKAQEAPGPQVLTTFCDVLMRELSPWCERFGTSLVVKPMTDAVASPWRGLALEVSQSGANRTVPASDWEGLTRAADEVAGTEVLIRLDGNALLIGRLAQQRYWSQTQARLLAQRIVWSHLDVLKGQAVA